MAAAGPFRTSSDTGRSAAFLLGVLLLAMLVAIEPGAAHKPGAPLFRADAHEETWIITPGRSAETFLGVPPVIDGRADINLSFRYQCIKSHGTSGVELDDGTSDSCAIGTEPTPTGLSVGAAAPYVTVSWSTDEGPKNGGGFTRRLEAEPGTPTMDLTFAGSMPADGLKAYKDGDVLSWSIQASLRRADCNGDHVDEDANCSRFDPQDTSAQKNYRAVLDMASPKLNIIESGPWQGSWHAGDIEMFLVLPDELRTPAEPFELHVGFVENESRGGLVANTFRLWWNGEEITASARPLVTETHEARWAVTVKGNGPASSSSPLNRRIDPGSAVRIDASLEDEFGHIIDTRARAWGAAYIGFDAHPPEIGEADFKHVAAPDGTIGSNVRVEVVVDDPVGEREGEDRQIHTPEDRLTVEGRLTLDGNGSARDGPPWVFFGCNQSCWCYRAEALVAPTSVTPNSAVYLQVRATDTVGFESNRTFATGWWAAQVSESSNHEATDASNPDPDTTSDGPTAADSNLEDTSAGPHGPGVQVAPLLIITALVVVATGSTAVGLRQASGPPVSIYATRGARVATMSLGLTIPLALVAWFWWLAAQGWFSEVLSWPWRGASLEALALLVVITTASILFLFTAARLVARAERARSDASDAARVGMERAHKKASNQAEQLEMLLSGAYHDLKAPLSALHWLTKDLEEDLQQADPESVRDTLARLQRSVGGMDQMVDDLSALAKIDDAAEPRGWVPMGKIVREILDQTEELQRRKNAQFIVSWDKLPHVLASEPRLRQALHNLVTNALKYGKPSGGRITIHGFRSGSTLKDPWSIEVTDDGPGIHDDDKPFVFELFRRGSNVEGTEGTGLGLALVKRALEADGAKIHVEDAPGTGARFVITWPGAKGQRPATTT